MTARPPGFPPEIWPHTLAGSVERVHRNYGRAYCALVAKPYRKSFRWTIDYLGLFGLPLAAALGGTIRFIDWWCGEPEGKGGGE